MYKDGFGINEGSPQVEEYVCISIHLDSREKHNIDIVDVCFDCFTSVNLRSCWEEPPQIPYHIQSLQVLDTE